MLRQPVSVCPKVSPFRVYGLLVIRSWFRHFPRAPAQRASSAQGYVVILLLNGFTDLRHATRAKLWACCMLLDDMDDGLIFASYAGFTIAYVYLKTECLFREYIK